MTTAEGSLGYGEAILDARTALGIELGSTRIKACLIDANEPSRVLATGAHEWENDLVDGVWTYSLDAVWTGLHAAYAALVDDAERRHGVRPSTYDSIGISAMMHGYLAFDADGELLAPFRTWRNTTTGPAAAQLTELFGVNIPLRWSIAHLHQAVLDAEPHLSRLHSLTTLAGYVHRALTGRHVLGVGDASGMFPIDVVSADYDAACLERYEGLLRDRGAGAATRDGRQFGVGDAPAWRLRELLPQVLAAGDAAGELTAAGAALLDPTGALRAGIPLCPPEGDAGTGMVATAAVAPRTGNVSAGTSIFAMVVLERPIAGLHQELDLVATPAGDPVAMVHCNNGASELAAWVSLFDRFGRAAGLTGDIDAVYDVLFREALDGAADAGGLLAYNQLSGEPLVGLAAGRPLIVRTPEHSLNLGDFMRAQLYGVFATLAIGMQVLTDEGVGLDTMLAHGGLFRTAGVAQRFLAGALDVPVSVAATASEGGAWGIAVLAAYATTRANAAGHSNDTARERLALGDYLRERVFAADSFDTIQPQPEDVAGFRAYLHRYRAGLAVEALAVETLAAEALTAETPAASKGNDA